MKITTALLTLVLTACFSLAAGAEESIVGQWRAESVSSVEPPEGVSLTLRLGDEDKATITYTLSGEAQSWDYTYTIEDGQLKLDPTAPFGEPETVIYDFKVDEEGKLLLLTPKPEPLEEETPEETPEEETEEGEGEETETEEEEEEEEEEDTRTPVWVLIKA